jgi:tetratricopeptide (TPR) repeat protein
LALVLLVIPAISRSSPPGPPLVNTEKTSTAAKDDLGQLLRFEQSIRDGKLHEVEPLLRDYLKAHPKSARAYYDLGYVCFRTHDLTASVEALARSLELEVNNAEAHKILGLDLTMIGRYDEAQLEMEQAVRLKPDSAEIHYFLGRIHYTRNAFPLAKHEFEEAIRLDPSYMKAYDNLGLTMEGAGDDKAALASYAKAIALMKQQGLKSEWPYINVCAMYNRLKKPAQALEYCQKAIELNPKSAQAFFETARVHMEGENWEAAAKALQSAIENNPRFPRYHYVLSTVYRKIGKREESEREMEAFRKLSEETAPRIPQGIKGGTRGEAQERPDLRQ